MFLRALVGPQRYQNHGRDSQSRRLLFKRASVVKSVRRLYARTLIGGTLAAGFDSALKSCNVQEKIHGIGCGQRRVLRNLLGTRGFRCLWGCACSSSLQKSAVSWMGRKAHGGQVWFREQFGEAVFEELSAKAYFHSS